MKLLYYSLVDWKWIKQRPHFICEHLSRLGIAVHFAYPHVIAKALFVRGRHVSNAGCPEIRKIKIRQLPKENAIPIIYRINEKYRARRLSRLLSRESYDAAVITHPMLYSPAVASSGVPIVFEMMDEYSSFANVRDVAAYMSREKKLCCDARAIVTSSLSLRSLLIERYPECKDKITVINNAFDADAVSHWAQGGGEKSAGGAKTLVYAGTLSEWLDYKSIAGYAKRHPEDVIRLIGPAENLPDAALAELRSHRNIKLTGPVEHSEALRHIQNADIVLIPFIVNRLIEHVDPVKAYEYISLRKPIVGSYWPEMERFRGFMAFYDPNIEGSFDIAVGEAAEIRPGGAAYEAFCAQNSWAARAKEYMRVLESL